MQKYLILFLLIFISSCEKDTDLMPAFAVDGEVETIFENDPNGINIIFIGEGFGETHFSKPDGSYKINALKHVNYLFSIPPFSEYKEYFNAYIVYAISQDEFISRHGEPLRNTAFGAMWVPARVSIEGIDKPKVHEYARKAVPNHSEPERIDIILFSVNGYGGGVARNGITVFGVIKERTMLHELGHTFGLLADEYEEDNSFIDPWRYANLDQTNDLNEVKWSHFIGLEGYESVSAYIGGGRVPNSYGIYRPSPNSVMRDYHTAWFNAPSREAIVKRIMEIKGLPYNFQEFLEKDVRHY